MGKEFYTFVEQQGSRIFHKYIDSDGIKKTEVIRSFPIELFVQGKQRVDSSVGILGEILNKVEFDDISDAKEFITEYQDIQNIYGQTNLMYQFIGYRYPDDIDFDFKKITVLAIDIEVAYDDSGFPTAQKANQEILSIACKVIGSSAPFVVFGTKDTCSDEFEFVWCDNESVLLEKFQKYWRDINPDIVTGWNCIPVSQSVWMDDRILTLNELQEKDNLYGSVVHHIFPQSIKPIVTINLKNGHKVSSSKDHRFPIFRFPLGKYIDPTNDILIQDDASVEDIQNLLSNNAVYLRQELRDNTSTDITYRKFIVENLDLLLSKGMNIVVRDTEIVRKVTAVSKSSWENNQFEDWTVERISQLLSRKEVLKFIERSSALKIYSPNINKSAFIVELDEVISLEHLWMSGMWYTDGTQSYKTEVSICNKEESIAKEVNRIIDPFRRVSRMSLNRNTHDGCFYITTGLSHVWFWKLFIYDHVKSCSNKKIDVALLSQLSKRQFMAFIGGCVDGDGSVTEHGMIQLHNFNGDTSHFAELLNWNGIFTTIWESDQSVTFYHENLNEFIFHPKKKINLESSNPESRKRYCKSNNLSWIINDDHALVRIKQIDFDEKLTTMVDISTNTSYFVSKGVKTHNCEGFDIPYIINRSNKIKGEKFTRKFSCFHNNLENCITEYSLGGNIPNPSNLANNSISQYNNIKEISYRIVGVTVIDYLDLYKKYSGSRLESYRLEVVAQHELGTGKVNYDEYNGLMGLYEQNYDLFLKYNMNDVKLIEQFEKKLNYLVLAATVSYLGKMRFSDIHSQVRFWDNYIYNSLLAKGIQISPQKQKPQEEIVGAYVKDTIQKLYKWIVTVDLTSLYPSIIMTANLSPETIVKEWCDSIESIDDYITMKKDLSWAKDNDVCVIANGSAYTRKKLGIFPELVKGMFLRRKEFKKHAIQAAKELEALKEKGASVEILDAKKSEEATYDAKQQAFKIALNSLYGASANRFFRYNNRSIAEGITITGQLIIRFISDRLNSYLNGLFKTSDIDYIIFNDTDSAGLNLEYIVNKMFKDQSNIDKIVTFLDKFTKTHIDPFLESEFARLTDYLNAYENMISMKREVIADRGLWRGKKNYILQVWDKEGIRYKKPKLKMMGIETAKSSTPNIVRGSLEKAIGIILNGNETELQQYVKTFKDQFWSAPASEIAFPRGVRDIDKWLESGVGKFKDVVIKKGAPIHVKGCINYNNLLKKFSIEGTHPKIKNGDKIKFLHLYAQNPTHLNSIAFIDILPKEFGMDEFIDKNMQFEKTFLDPLKSFTSIIGWSTEEINSIDSFFE